MATANYEYNFIDSAYTSSSVTSMRRNFIGTRMTGVNTDIRNKIPKFAKINSATCTIRIKRDGTSDLKMYNHDMAWLLYDESDAIVSTLTSQTQAIRRSYTTFSYDVLSRVNSQNADSGVATSIYCLSFRASGDLSKKYTYDIYRVSMSYTLPTIKVVGNVNDSNWGEVISATHTLGSAIDIGTIISYGKKYCELIARAKTGYRFVQWSDGETSAIRDVELSENVLTAHNTTLTYTAIFEPIKYTVTVNTSPEGSGDVIGGGSFEYGKTTTIVAAPHDGYRFVRWSDENTDNTNASRTITITSDVTYTAIFAPISNIFIGNQRVSVYIGTQKVSAYIGTQKLS